MNKGILHFVKITLVTIPFFLTSFLKAQPVLSFVNPIGGLSVPVDIVNAGDGSNRLFIVQQRGLIRIYDQNTSTLLATPFLDVSTLLSGGSEQGLLSMAFYPNYEHTDSAYFFIYYTNLAGDIVVARYQPTTPTANTANPATAVILLAIPKPTPLSSFSNHNGGKLNFGPDNYLYFGTGDGGSGNDPNQLAQNRNSLLGKMLRIDVKDFSSNAYAIPPDNPYAAPGGFRDEIWSWGLRNPWRWSFDRLTKAMFIGDVGQSAWEEIDYRPDGSTGSVNYGWRCFEGSSVNAAVAPCTPSTTPVTAPIYEYSHDPTTGGMSIVGGYVYRGTNFTNSPMVGYYIFNDTYRPNTWIMNTNVGGFPTIRQPGLQNGISTFGEDEAGELYVASLFTNLVYRVMVSGTLPIQLVSFSGKGFTGYNELKWKTGTEQNINRFVIEYSINGRDYQSAGEVTPFNDPAGHEYNFRHYINSPGKIYYRIRTMENSGTDLYSAVIMIGGADKSLVKVYPTVVTDGRLQIVAGKAVNHYSIYDSNGGLITAKDMSDVDGYFQVSLPVIVSGVYWIRLDGADWTETHRFIIR